jgi:hypothetical protein
LLVNTKETPKCVEGLTGRCAANVVHTRVEEGIATPETLQAAANLVGLFEHGDMVAVLCQNDTAGQTAQTTTYDDTLLH